MAAPAQSPAERNARFEALYNSYHRPILAYCSRRTTPSDAWDATAEVFLLAWRRAGDLPEHNDALPWLFAAAYRVLANQRRGHARRTRLLDRVSTVAGPGSEGPPDELLLRSEEDDRVLAALSALSALDREVIQLSIWEELPAVQIASVLEISTEAVYQRFSRAKRRLARELGVEEEMTSRATRHVVKKGKPT